MLGNFCKVTSVKNGVEKDITNELNYIIRNEETTKGTFKQKTFRKLHKTLIDYLNSLNNLDESNSRIKDIEYGFKSEYEINCFRCNARTYKNLNENNISYCDSCRDKNRNEMKEKLFKI